MTLTLNSFGVTTFYYSDSAYICPQGITGQIITEVSKKETITFVFSFDWFVFLASSNISL